MKKPMTLLLPTFAIADPGLMTQHFKNEQATLFDLGMFVCMRPLSCAGGSFTCARPEACELARPAY